MYGGHGLTVKAAVCGTAYLGSIPSGHPLKEDNSHFEQIRLYQQVFLLVLTLNMFFGPL